MALFIFIITGQPKILSGLSLSIYIPPADGLLLTKIKTFTKIEFTQYLDLDQTRVGTQCECCLSCREQLFTEAAWICLFSLNFRYLGIKNGETKYPMNLKSNLNLKQYFKVISSFNAFVFSENDDYLAHHHARSGKHDIRGGTAGWNFTFIRRGMTAMSYSIVWTSFHYFKHA